MNDFEKFAVSRGVSTHKLDDYKKKNFNLTNYRGVNPIILEEREMNVIGLDIFSRLMYDRILFLGTPIDDDTANIVTSQLMYLNSIGDDDIKMFINSPGGSVIAGLSIYDIMNFVNPDVSTYCMGMCASMASVLLSSGAKGKRYSLPNGEVMIHQVSGGTEGPFSDMKIAVEHAGRLQNKLFNILSQNTGNTFEQIKEDADRDKWFTADEALKYGLIDEIIVTAKR